MLRYWARYSSPVKPSWVLRASSCGLPALRLSLRLCLRPSLRLSLRLSPRPPTPATQDVGFAYPMMVSGIGQLSSAICSALAIKAYQHGH